MIVRMTGNIGGSRISRCLVLRQPTDWLLPLVAVSMTRAKHRISRCLGNYTGT